ncbi:MAG: type I DNA topoisomerase [Oscillospiraceae bacterium]|jgi:DNA topoisomerase-1|nr:type I DNA topoisomerase [Oscillospiraceae bacterium]
MANSGVDLVIVESPAKAKTIGKYLGSGYRVTASMGHLRDLPKSKLGVDIENGFIPDYQPVKGREDTIKALKTAARGCKRVYLATDPDREGEAISWHLKELLGLPDERVSRVTFNEITKNVVRDSIAHPRDIDQDLVDAQQARRILDRIVGYKLSPLLWRKIRRGLSAGRVQSVAARMVTDREDEIRAFVPEEYWLVDVDLSLIGKDGRFWARFYGGEKGRAELHGADEVDAVVSAVSKAPFVIGAVKRADKKRSPPPPFITSTLQQEASRKLGMTPRRAMSVAQQLYEGVEIAGEGTVGLITYMRTDSLRLSDEALGDAKRYITDNFGPDYHPGQPIRYKTKSGAQDAHEAIRPSSVFITPDRIRQSVSNDQFRLYKLIWSRFLACQMKPAIYDSLTVDAISAGYVFRANHSALKFAGFMSVYTEGRDDEGDEDTRPLPALAEGDGALLEDIKSEQKFTQPPPRYTEASLIKAMEDTGVGRPSTYAPTISTIIDREYVVKEGKTLRPTPLGEVVTQLMKDRFSDVVDLKFTARMEEILDEVEKGKSDWKRVLGDFYGGFAESVSSAETALEGERIKVPDEESDEVCDLCGRRMVVKSGRFGRFLGCPGYPECSFTKPIVVEMPGKCPRCGGRILKRTSKNGYTYYACEKLKECGFMTWDVPVAENCQECGDTLFKKSGRGSKKPYCVNEKCKNFLPEDQRGYRKKTDSDSARTESTEADAADGAGAGAGAKKPAAKKIGAKKAGTAAKKTEAPAKSGAAGRRTTKKAGAAAKNTPVKE